MSNRHKQDGEGQFTSRGTTGTPFFSFKEEREIEGEWGREVGECTRLGVPGVPAPSPAIPDRPYDQPADVVYDWQERSAIYEFDAGMARIDADLQAQCDEQARRVRLAAAAENPRP